MVTGSLAVGDIAGSGDDIMRGLIAEMTGNDRKLEMLAEKYPAAGYYPFLDPTSFFQLGYKHLQQ
jgi:hypothetical protein